MKIWQVILATLVIFGTGVVTGGLLVDYSNRGQPHPWRQKGDGPRLPGGNQPRETKNEPKGLPQLLQFPPHGLRTNLVERLDRDLKLTPEQHRHIEKIIIESQERTKELWKEYSLPFRKEIQEAKERIRTVLTPEQREKFEELMQRPQQPRKPDEPLPPNERRLREPRRQIPPQELPEQPRNP